MIENYPQGYWKVKDKKFLNKYQALLYSVENNNVPVDYCYFDSIWQNFDRSLLGKFTLQELYRQRAQQLRDRYDYLILYFSGGADSYNVLRSFIDNGIHLDEICVKWCNDTLESNTQVYVPNNVEGSALNYLSEWDLAIKPVLDEISRTHPKIKIQIVDWFKNKNLIGTEDIFSKVNHWHDIEVTSLAIWSPSENALIDKGLKVGSIYGVDKPCIIFDDEKKGYMFFPDGGTAMGTPSDNNIYGTEYFYWSPEFPLLSFEMARVAINAYRTDSVLSSVAVTTKNRYDIAFMIYAWQIQQKRLRHVLYNNWTDRFQAYKPMTPNRSDKHFWIYNHSELSGFKDAYEDMLDLHIRQLKDSVYLSKGTNSIYNLIPSKKHFVC